MVAFPQHAQALPAPGELQSSKLILNHIYKYLQNLVKMWEIPIQPFLAKTKPKLCRYLIGMWYPPGMVLL